MAIKAKREALVYQHLERISRNLLERHSDIVRGRIGRNPRIYALYRKGKLYYVGLASSLSSRLKAHLRDRHKDSWDQFAIYLTVRDHHIKELESLLLRISRPNGNSVTGKPKGSMDLLPHIRREITSKQRLERQLLFGRKAIGSPETEEFDERGEIRKLSPNGAKICARYKGEIFKARIRRDGKIRYQGETFESLGLAAKKAAGRRKNSWVFWRVERGHGNWIKLKEIRNAGTPILSRGKRRPIAFLLAAAKRAWKTRRAAH